MNWLKENWFKLSLLITILLLAFIFGRFDFVPEQVTETKEFIQRCHRITGECEAATPLTKEGLKAKLGL